MREREAKLVVPHDFEIPPARSLAKRVAQAQSDRVTQHAVYYDTPDLRLTRSGVSFRYRSDDGWTVKLPEARTASTLTRSELAFPGDRGAPPARALSLVRPWSRARPLVEIATVDTRREKTRLLDTGSDLLAEIDDDDVVGTTADGKETRFREVEIELGEDTPDSFLADVVRRLRTAGAHPSRAASKIARVLGAAADAPPDVPEELRIRADATVADVVRAAIVRSLRQLVSYDPAIRLSGDVESVHKARVATRRLRSDLRTFRPVLEWAWSEPLRAELQWLGRALGQVRDADVLLDALAARAAALPDAHQPAAAQLRCTLEAARRRDRDELLETLDSDRYVALLDELVAAADRPRLRDGTGRSPVGVVARRLVAKPQRRFDRHARDLDRRAPDAALHEARKRAKQVRYASEALAPVLGRRARVRARRFADVQQVLGEHQDAVVAGAWLFDAARDTEDRDDSFVAGELAGRFLDAKLAARAKWPAVRTRALKVGI
jgi:CHAD domain-containing protein